MNLADYERAKFDLAETLRGVSHALKQSSAESDPEWLRELFARLAEDRFNLVVVGRFSRGKTTLINAILGIDRLPVGIVPLTSVITCIAYGSREEVRIRYQDKFRLTENVPLAKLAHYVTQEFNPGNVRQVAAAEIRLPADILRRGFRFIDTPGLGSAIAANTETTRAFLPEADAFVLVTSFESPLSEEEQGILRIASQSARRLFVVVNKQDLVTDAERDAALDYVRAQIAAATDGRAPMLFGISAREALNGRLAHDDALLSKSGLPTFESELTRFLLGEKRGALLLNLCARINEAIRTLPKSAAIAALGGTLATLSERLAASSHEFSPSDREEMTLGLIAPLRDCTICAQIANAVFDFLRHFQYELGTSPELQHEHAERGGFCPQHTWEYGTLASPHGFCVGNPPLLEGLAARFLDLAAKVEAGPSLPAAIAALLPNERNCPVCGVQQQAEKNAVAALADKLRGATPAAFERLPVICLPHLRRLSAELDDIDARRRLLEHQAAILRRVAEDMRRYATQHDAIRRNLSNDDELHANRNALNALAGLRHINGRSG